MKKEIARTKKMRSTITSKEATEFLPLVPDVKLKKKVVLKESVYHPKNKLNHLKGNEWLYFTKTILQTSYPHELGHDLRKEHGGCKPPQLMQHIIEFFTKKKDTILDPFAGVGGTLLGASLAGRKCAGIEINKKWINIYHKVCKREKILDQEMIHGDCLEVLENMVSERKKFDFVVTDPPYSIALEKTMCDGVYDIQHRKTDFNGFSESHKDLRNLKTFDEYYDAMKKVGKLVNEILKPEKYFVLIIRDSYQNSKYIPASFEVAKRMEEVGFVLKGIKIWYATGSRMRPYGYPYVYIPNIVHQNIIILRKE